MNQYESILPHAELMPSVAFPSRVRSMPLCADLNGSGTTGNLG